MDIKKYFMTMEKTGIQLSRDGINIGEPIVKANDLVVKLIESGYRTEVDSLKCSASLDFPDKYTDDVDVIMLANKIREKV